MTLEFSDDVVAPFFFSKRLSSLPTTLWLFFLYSFWPYSLPSYTHIKASMDPSCWSVVAAGKSSCTSTAVCWLLSLFFIHLILATAIF
jgi:hypothetical protein